MMYWTQRLLRYWCLVFCFWLVAVVVAVVVMRSICFANSMCVTKVKNNIFLHIVMQNLSKTDMCTTQALKTLSEIYTFTSQVFKHLNKTKTCTTQTLKELSITNTVTTQTLEIHRKAHTLTTKSSNTLRKNTYCYYSNLGNTKQNQQFNY